MDLQCKLFVSGRVGGGLNPFEVSVTSHIGSFPKGSKVGKHLGNEQMAVWKKRVRTFHSWRNGVIYQQKAENFIEFEGGCVSKGPES